MESLLVKMKDAEMDISEFIAERVMELIEETGIGVRDVQLRFNVKSPAGFNLGVMILPEFIEIPIDDILNEVFDNE